MKHMKNLTLFGAAFLVALVLTGCGGKEDKSPEDSDQTTDTSLTKPSVTKGENKWPEANFITEDMKYTGKGDIVHTEYIDGEEDGTQDSSWIVFYKNAELNDVKKYIESLKSKGFKCTSENEPEVEFKNGMFFWDGKTDDGKHFVSVYITDHNALTTAGDLQTNIEMNMYVRMSNYDLNAAIQNSLDEEEDMLPEMSDEEANNN